MEFRFTPEDDSVIEEVIDFLDKEITPEVLAESEELGFIFGGPECRKLYQKLGARGWIMPTWPKEEGGIGSSEMLKFRILDAMISRGLPSRNMAFSIVGPCIREFGNAEQKKKYLLPIARGELEFALGYTEPQAGSDIASMETRAEDKGDYFLVNGQKMFNTHCHIADYHWLGVVTNPDAPKKHRGISLLIVDMKSQGITIRPIFTMSGERTNEVFYDDVKVPKENLIGEINRGFYYIMAALDFERNYPIATFSGAYNNLVKAVKTIEIDGKLLAKDHVVRQKMGQLETEMEIGMLLYYKVAWMIDNKIDAGPAASILKVFASELYQHVAFAGMEIMGLYGVLQRDPKWSPSPAKWDYYFGDSILATIAAGTSEIQRNIIAQRGLGLPRS